MCPVIFHIDVNSAFLSWESMYRIRVLHEETDYRTIPAAVTGDRQKRKGIILAKSESAKKYGIRTGEPVTDALKKCPELVCISPHYDFYVENSEKFMNILKEYTPTVEKYSIDEAFCDMTETLHLYGTAMETALKIKNRIREELGFTVNIGISENKLLAKMASDFEKPDKVHTLFPEEIKEKMWPLPVSDLFFVGKASTKKLNQLGIFTIGELAAADIGVLTAHFKSYGRVIHEYANGIYREGVEPEPTKNKGYGNRTTLPFDVSDRETAQLVLLSLCETVCARLRSHEVKAAVIAVELTYSDFRKESHQMSLASASNIVNEIYNISCKLFGEMWHGAPIRLMGVSAHKVVSEQEGRQMSLFEDTARFEKLSQLDKAVDNIRNKFGESAVFRASFLDSPIAPMTGELSRKKDKR